MPERGSSTVQVNEHTHTHSFTHTRHMHARMHARTHRSLHPHYISFSAQQHRPTVNLKPYYPPHPSYVAHTHTHTHHTHIHRLTLCDRRHILLCHIKMRHGGWGVVCYEQDGQWTRAVNTCVSVYEGSDSWSALRTQPPIIIKNSDHAKYPSKFQQVIVPLL